MINFNARSVLLGCTAFSSYLNISNFLTLIDMILAVQSCLFAILFAPVDSTAEAAAFIKTFRLCLCSVVSRSYASALAALTGHNLD